MEAVEGTAIADQLAALLLEHVPDRALRLVDMAVCLGPGDAPVEQPGVHLLVAPEAQPRRQEALAHQPNLVLNLPLLPARRRAAGQATSSRNAWPIVRGSNRRLWAQYLGGFVALMQLFSGSETARCYEVAIAIDHPPLCVIPIAPETDIEFFLTDPKIRNRYVREPIRQHGIDI